MAADLIPPRDQEVVLVARTEPDVHRRPGRLVACGERGHPVHDDREVQDPQYGHTDAGGRDRLDGTDDFLLGVWILADPNLLRAKRTPGKAPALHFHAKSRSQVLEAGGLLRFPIQSGVRPHLDRKAQDLDAPGLRVYRLDNSSKLLASISFLIHLDPVRQE